MILLEEIPKLGFLFNVDIELPPLRLGEGGILLAAKLYLKNKNNVSSNVYLTN